MTRPRFEATVSLGSIITAALGTAIVPFLIYLVTHNQDQDVRLTALETAFKSSSEVATELRNGMRRIDDKITALLIQGYRSPPPTEHR